MNNRIIILDFDGTCVKHEFPEVGEDIGAIPVLLELTQKGHHLILSTMRCNHTFEPTNKHQPDIIAIKGNYLDDAVNWFKENNIPLYGIQTNPHQHTWTTSPKPYGHLLIDDIALGVPLIYGKHDKPYVDWKKVRVLLDEEGIL